MRDLLTIGELAARSGVAPSALRYYERLGLIRADAHRRQPAPLRARRAAPGRVHPDRPAGRRLAGRDPRRRWPTLPEGRTPTKADWARLSARWRGRLDEQIALLERLRDDARPAASAAAACRCSAAGSTTPATSWPRRAPARASCCADQRARTSPAACPPKYLPREVRMSLGEYENGVPGGLRAAVEQLPLRTPRRRGTAAPTGHAAWRGSPHPVDRGLLVAAVLAGGVRAHRRDPLLRQRPRPGRLRGARPAVAPVPATCPRQVQNTFVAAVDPDLLPRPRPGPGRLR